MRGFLPVVLCFGKYTTQIFSKRSQEYLPPLQAIVEYYNYSRGE